MSVSILWTPKWPSVTGALGDKLISLPEAGRGSLKPAPSQRHNVILAGAYSIWKYFLQGPLWFLHASVRVSCPHCSSDMSCPSQDFAAFVLPCGTFSASDRGCVEPGRTLRTAAQAQGFGSAGWGLGPWEYPGHPSGGGLSWLISSQTMESIRDLSAVLSWMSGTHFQVQIKPKDFHRADWQAASHCR